MSVFVAVLGHLVGDFITFVVDSRNWRGFIFNLRTSERFLIEIWYLKDLVTFRIVEAGGIILLTWNDYVLSWQRLLLIIDMISIAFYVSV